ncbi:MAG TPA: EamA family transporter [Actinomycetota bacterium]|nr:EamA family transporter [Actinomycetota bacterium]
MSVALATVAALAWGVAELLMLRGSRRLRPLGLARWLMVFGTVMILPVALFTGPIPSGRDLPYAVAPALFALGGTLAYFRALSTGQLTIVSPTVATSGGFAALVAIVLLGERFSPLVMAGLALGVVGVVVATYVRDGGRAEGVAWAVLGAVLLGVYTVALAASSERIGPVWSVAAYRLTGLLVLWAAAPFSGAPLGPPRADLGLVLRAAAIETVGFAAFTTALDLGPVAVVAVIAAQFSTVAVVLGAVVLHERLHRHQWVGVAMMIGSTTLLAALQ